LELVQDTCPPMPLTSKLTGLSTPLRLSFSPVSGLTNNGSDTLARFSSSANAFSKKSLHFYVIVLMATSYL